MRKKFDINSIKAFDVIRTETRIWTKLERALLAEGVVVDSNFILKLIDFAKVFVQYTNLKKIGSKRNLENNLDFRINTIRRLVKQLKQDDPILDDFLGEDFLKRQISYALIEKATLIFERMKGNDVRDISNIDFKLLKIVNELQLQKIQKPIETLAVAIQKSGILKDISKSGWSVRTLQNRISKIKARSVVSQKNQNQSPMKLATKYLQKELSQQSSLIAQLSQSLPNMKEHDLYILVPTNSKYAFPYLFTDIEISK